MLFWMRGRGLPLASQNSSNEISPEPSVSTCEKSSVIRNCLELDAPSPSRQGAQKASSSLSSMVPESSRSILLKTLRSASGVSDIALFAECWL